MKTWKKYQQFTSHGEWHIHTTYTDGLNTVEDYCKKAEKLGIPLLAFTEHVRQSLSYDFNDFLSEISDARENFDLHILSGCEVKVLPEGNLDVPDWVLESVDYPVFAFHSFPYNKVLYLDCLKKVIMHPSMNTWAHPGLFCVNNGIVLSQTELHEIFSLMKKFDIALEYNKKYHLPQKEWIQTASLFQVQIIRGSDIHSVERLESYHREYF